MGPTETTTIDNEIANDDSRRKIIGDNSVIMMFTTSMVKHAASPQLRLPANFIGVQSVRQDFKKPSSAKKLNKMNGRRFSSSAIKKVNHHLRASNEVKFYVVDKSGNDRRMTKAEKKAKKIEMAQAKKEAKKEDSAKKKRKVELMVTGGIDDAIKKKLNCMEDDRVMEQHEPKLYSSPEESAKTSIRSYHQFPVNPTTIEQEIAEFRDKRGYTSPVILSPPMALQFVSKNNTIMWLKHSERLVKNSDCIDVGGNATFVYDHELSQEWANILKYQCILPAESVRQREDLRPLAYRLHPEPWQRLRASLDENRVATRNRNDSKAYRQLVPSSSKEASKSAKGIPNTSCNNGIPKTLSWVLITCRPRIKTLFLTDPFLETATKVQHDDVLSIVFEYIHRETSYYVSCGAKFGSDFLIYDGPRDKRHAFAGMRVLSRFTSSMTRVSSRSTTEPSLSHSDAGSLNDDVIELPLPTAYSLTGFVRCLNTAGKLALLATVDEVSDDGGGVGGDTDGNKSTEGKLGNTRKKYRVAFVDVALEKILDVHKRKNRGRSDNKKLQKRRDVTQTLSKTYE